MPVIYSNNASTSLSAGINNSTTTIPIASASGFPTIGTNEYFFATIANTANTKIEVVKVTAGTTSLTVVRAQGGTSAQAFDSGDNFQLRVTADTLEAATKTDVNITGGAIAGAAITNDVIDSQHYADGSIDHAHLSNDCIDGDNIQDNAVDSEHYVDGSIDTAHIAGDAVTNTKIANGAISSAGKIANDVIDSQHYVDGSIDTAHIGDDQVTADKLANSINSEIAANTAKVTNATHSGEVTGATALTIADDVVDEANLKISNAGTNGYFLQKQSGNTGGLTWAEVDTTIANDSIDSQHYAAGSIDNEHIADNAINSEHYADGSIDEAHLADSAVNTAKIANSSITADKLAANCVDSSELVNGSIDSSHFAAGAVDTTALGADCVTAAKIGNDVINSEHIAAGSIDLEHMSSQSVDEDNLYISNSGSNGQFLSKQSGNNGGLTWATVSSEDYIPDGSVMAFFQANAPTGWTKVTSQNDKVLRVVSGTGGGTGGSAAFTSPAHNLAAGAHTLSTSELASHSHGGVITGGGSVGNYPGNAGSWRNWITSLSSGSTSAAGSGSSHSHSMSGSITTPQYIDVIICSKDA